MAVNYPETLDSFINPASNSSVANPSHAEQHSDANDAIEALQQKVGVDNSTVPTSLDYRVATLENASIDEEAIQQIVGDLFTTGVHTNISVVYDNDNDRINLTGTYGDEEAISAIAIALTAGTGITKTYVETPTGYIGEYDNGYDYQVGNICSTGNQAQYWIRTGEPNQGYPPYPGSPYWTAYAFSKTITIAVDTSSIATQTYVNTAISNLVDAAPGLLDTLNEIAAAIGDDANFASTVNTAITNAVTTANEYTDEAIASLGNSLPNTYIPLSYYGNEEGVATLDINGFVPQTQLDIDARIKDTAAEIITNATHTNITVNYDSVAKELSLTSTGGTSADISSTAPVDPNVGDLWLDADTAILYIYDGAFWVEISGSGGGGGSSGTGGGFTASATAPTSPVEGSAWFDTVNAKLYVYYDSYWVEAVATGATGPQGPAFLNYLGTWSSGVSYLENDGVTYQGSLWRLNEVSSPAGTAPSTPNWQLVIEKGDKGDTGEMTVGTVTTVLFGAPPTITNVGTTTDAILNFEIPAGRASTIEVGTVDTVLFGNPPTVVNSGDTSDAVFDFEIPAGRAATITVGTVEDVLYGNPPTVTNSGDVSDAVFDFEIPAGRAATIAIGEVTTVTDGNPATVTNSGDTSDAVFDFQIPAGPRSTIVIGDVVDVDFGNPSTVTNVGTTSDAIFDFELQTGRASTLAVGTVTTGTYYSDATVENVGTTSDAIFNFSIPQGIPGDFQPGVTPPTNPLTGQVWYNTTTGRAYIYYDSFWVEFSPGFTGQQGPQGPAGPAGADGADGSSMLPVEITANTNIIAGSRYFVSSSSELTLTLPASPVLNDEIQILDASGNASTYNITVARNGNKINGGTGNLIIDMNGSWVVLLYTGSTYGWKVG
jgi:hypothetical protein